MKPIIFSLLLLMAGCVVLDNDAVIKAKEISTIYAPYKYRYVINAKENDDLILYSNKELNVGDTLKFR
jgi:hypothetical protein